MANVVAPELTISETMLDFGEIFIDEVKILPIQFHNTTPFSIVWKDLRSDISEKIFKILPESAHLRPDQKENVFVCY